MGVLSATELHRRIFEEPEDDRRLTVSPLLDSGKQLRGNSLDVRLGSHFITHRRANVSCIDPQDEDTLDHRCVVEEEIYVPIGDYFVLHPRQFAIGGTLEYIGMPCDLSAYVMGKSSWGRLGLVIATATGVHAWFRGIITLELTNLGEVPLLLYPGRTVAQLFFHSSQPQTVNEADISSYFGAVRPVGSRLGPDPKIRPWGDLLKRLDTT